DVLPANIDLSAAEVQLVGEVAREQVLARALSKVTDEYDVILIDCQPSLGLLAVNALTASHGVIIPLETEFFALRVVALLIETIDEMLVVSVINLTVKFPAASYAADPITNVAPNHAGSEAYRRQARQLIARGGAP